MENSHQASNKKDISKFEVYLYLLSDFIKWRQYGGINEKIEVLRKIAHQFNEEEVIWALGASMLLYFKGITSEFHDIDLMIAEELHPSKPNPGYQIKTFILNEREYSHFNACHKW